MRTLLLLGLVPGLVALAACGTAAPPAAPLTPQTALSPTPVLTPTRTPTTAGPTAAAEPAAPESPSGGPRLPAAFTVVLDPGHNGANASNPARINRPVPSGRGGTKACNTTGTATDAGYSEAGFNWDVALRVRDALTARGVQVVLTRPDNTGVGPCVDERAAVASQVGADALVSIHADGARPSGHGFHVAYSDPPLNPSQGRPSVELAEALAEALRTSGFDAADYIGAQGLDARSDLAGLNLAQVPAALVECANMRNPVEAALVSTPDGRARYAAAITDGIMGWLAQLP